MKRKKLQRIIATAAAGVLAFTAAPLSANAAAKVMPDGYAFDASYYAENNPDVASAIGTDENALYQHYENYGKNEGRPAYDPNEEIVAENINPELSVYLADNLLTIYQQCPSIGKIEYGFHVLFDNGSLESGTILGVESDSTNYSVFGVIPGMSIDTANSILGAINFSYVKSGTISNYAVHEYQEPKSGVQLLIATNSDNIVCYVIAVSQDLYDALYPSDSTDDQSSSVTSIPESPEIVVTRVTGFGEDNGETSLKDETTKREKLIPTSEYNKLYQKYYGDLNAVWEAADKGYSHSKPKAPSNKDNSNGNGNDFWVSYLANEFADWTFLHKIGDELDSRTSNLSSSLGILPSQDDIETFFNTMVNTAHAAASGNAEKVKQELGEWLGGAAKGEIEGEFDNYLDSITDNKYSEIRNAISFVSTQAQEEFKKLGIDASSIQHVFKGIPDLAKAFTAGMEIPVKVEAAESSATDAVVSNKDLQNFLGKSVSTTSPFKEAQTLSTGALPQGFTFVGWDDNKNISEIAVNYESDPQAQYYFGNPALKVGTTFDSANSWLLKHGYSVVSEMTPFETVPDSIINLAKSKKWDYQGNTLYLEAQVYQKGNVLVYIVVPSWDEDAPQFKAAIAAEEEKLRQINEELEQESNDYNGSQGISYGFNDCGDLSFIYEIRVAYANE